MTNQNRKTNSIQKKPVKQQARSPFSLRTLASLLMFAGVVVFIISLLVYGGNVLCLMGSTLLTFIGLGLTVAERRYHVEAGEVVEEAGLPSDQEEVYITPAAKVVETTDQQAVLAEEKTAPVKTIPVHVTAPEEQPVERQSLLDLAVDAFRHQGAQVDVESQRDDRGILNILMADGKNYKALVLEKREVIETADVRALFSLTMGSGSQGGYLITEGQITEQAETWARHRRINLVNRDWLLKSV